ncbi:MAG: hypothetical protein VKL59_22545 [Nostocaceae cyanobacterium]|nr:hypothetical protein [Nostocaceae cyanobacterium]
MNQFLSLTLLGVAAAILIGTLLGINFPIGGQGANQIAANRNNTTATNKANRTIIQPANTSAVKNRTEVADNPPTAIAPQTTAQSGSTTTTTTEASPTTEETSPVTSPGGTTGTEATGGSNEPIRGMW